MRIYEFTSHYDDPYIRIVITPNDNIDYYNDPEKKEFLVFTTTFVDEVNSILDDEQKEKLMNALGIYF